MHANHDIPDQRAVAQSLAAVFAHQQDVRAVLLCGSVARGWADRWSDVELVICRDKATSGATAATLLKAIGATSHRVFGREAETGAWEEEFAVQSYKVDLAQMAVHDITSLLRRVTVESDTSLQKHAIVAGIRDALPLHGKDLAQEWQRQAQVYPPELRRGMIRTNCAFGPQWWLEMLADRNDLLLLHDVLSRIGHMLLGTLLGLNETYTVSPSYKWSGKMARQLTIAPQNFPGRLESLFLQPPVEGVAEAGRLIEETFALVRRHAPEINVDQAFSRFSARRVP